MELERALEDLERMVGSELEKLAKKPELNPAEIKNATDAVCLLEKIQKVKAMSEEEDEYSERMSERGRGMRYSRASMRRGYSRHSINDRIVDKLERMMDDASSDYERSVLSGWIAKVESE